MRRINVVTGERYGSLIILNEVEKRGVFRTFLCKCDCGRVKVFRFNDIRTGHSTSCGCARTESCSSHGMSNLAEYKTWQDMKGRCLNKKHMSFGYYGGRGIQVCDRWMRFENFYEDMGPKPGKEYSIDRIDNGGDYCPDNCHWATRKDQNSNTRRNRIIDIGGVSRSVTEWASFVGVKYGTVSSRLSRGWDPVDAIYGRNT